MKKLIIPIVIAALSVSISGCSLNGVNPMEVMAENKKDVVSYNFDYSVKLSYEDKLKAEIKIENSKNVTIPLNVSDDVLFVAKLIKVDSGTILDTQKVSLEKRTEINKMEQVNKEVYFDVPNTGEYKVIVEQQLVNTSSSNYDEVQNSISTKMDVEVADAIEHHQIKYAKKRNILYKYKDASGKTIYSHFDYFDENKIQGLSNKYGVIVYAETEEGLKIEKINDYVGDINSLEFIDESKMVLFIPKYPEVGQTWKNGEKQFTVMGVNSSAKTAYGNLVHLIRIQVKEGKQVKDYYFDEELGLVKIVQKRSNSKKDITELQLLDIEVR